MSGEKGVRSAVRPVNCFEVLLKVMEALLEKKEKQWAMGYGLFFQNFGAVLQYPSTMYACFTTHNATKWQDRFLR